MSERIAAALTAWTRLAVAEPIWVGAASMLFALGVVVGLASAVRAKLQAASDRVSAGPIFALAGFIVLALSTLWWAVDAVLLWAGRLSLEERLLLLVVPDGPGSELFGRRAVASALASVQTGKAPVLPGVVLVPLMLTIAGALYVGLVLWMGRTLDELTSLEQKPDDVLARERAAQEEEIAKALREGRPIPAQTVATVPLADDPLGRVFKLLGYWTGVDRVEPRMLRWKAPLVSALTALSALALPAALGGHLAAPIWVGTAIALDGLRRNLSTREAPPPVKPARARPPSPEAPLGPPPLGPLVEAVHELAGPLLPAPASFVARGGQLSPGTHLQAKKVLGELCDALGLAPALYVHQGLACDAFAARKNVLVATPPLSGKEALVDLLVFYALLVEAENVLYVAESAADAARAERRFRERADAARWRWNVSMANLAGRAGAVDAARAQPGLVFADVDAVHRELCGRQEAYASYLGGLGLVVLPSVEAHDGARGAHLAHVLRRLRRARARALPLAPAKPSEGERVRVLATADPRFVDLGRHVERLAGRPFHVVGAEVDGAPEPARAGFFLAPLPPPGRPWADLEPAVQALGEALARGFAAELFGFDEVLATADVTRANEVMLGRGVATRGVRDEADRTARLAKAEVVVARASAATYTSLRRLASHVGFGAVAVPEARVAALGVGEEVGAGAAPAPLALETELDEELVDPETGEPLPPPAPPAPLPDHVLVLWQPDLDPLSELLAKERPPTYHPDLKLGCSLVLDPGAERIQRAHLACALAEAAVSVDELRRDFSAEVLEAHLGPGVLEALLASDPAAPRRGSERGLETAPGSGLVVTSERELDAATGALRWVHHLATHEKDAHAAVALDASGAATRIVDRHSGEALFTVARERARVAVYPGRVFVHAGRRFVSLPPEEVDDAVRCEREERALRTTSIRRVHVTAVERRSGRDRRAEPRAVERRANPSRSVGGASFLSSLQSVEVKVELSGLRRYGPDGAPRDVSYYDEPIMAAYETRAAIFALPEETFGEVPAGVLHTLAHLFRTTLPAFVRHREEDLDVVWLPRFGQAGHPAIAFVDGHPGGAGFAEAVTTEVLRHVIRWSLALTRRCPRGCRARAGCYGCVRILRCHSEHQDDLDKPGADAVLAKLVGDECSRSPD